MIQAARVFRGPRGGRISTAVLRHATHWDEAVTQLGYEHLRRHDLRHTGRLCNPDERAKIARVLDGVQNQ